MKGLIPTTASFIRLACSNDCAPTPKAWKAPTPRFTAASMHCFGNMENPNLHDIENMTFRVELWDRHAQHVRRVVAAAGTVSIGHAAFDEAVKNWPDERFTLRQGINLIREHPQRR